MDRQLGLSHTTPHLPDESATAVKRQPHCPCFTRTPCRWLSTTLRIFSGHHLLVYATGASTPPERSGIHSLGIEAGLRFVTLCNLASYLEPLSSLYENLTTEALILRRTLFAIRSYSTVELTRDTTYEAVTNRTLFPTREHHHKTFCVLAHKTANP
jgi:hypothetical protein